MAETSDYNFRYSSGLIKYSLALEKCKGLQFVYDRRYSVSETGAMKGLSLILILILIILGVPHIELSFKREVTYCACSQSPPSRNIARLIYTNCCHSSLEKRRHA